MGLEIRSNLKDYWSTRKVFSESFAAKLISRNRFVQILNAFHFADNDASDKSNRLYKIQPILDMLNEEFAAVYSPGKNVCIDESIIPFRGQAIFWRYIRGKRHKFGIKVYNCVVLVVILASSSSTLDNNATELALLHNKRF
ncbi:unnamed protein product [Haemonchus placei]|uniref:DDE_Tnp_1_7 domain-containing protein n=1 Tax=Haemonchus placei TaxID=6290 RepID=A0A0N4X887_HAEPC|nr:unnamed protein product [Haemonchus placei]